MNSGHCVRERTNSYKSWPTISSFSLFICYEMWARICEFVYVLTQWSISFTLLYIYWTTHKGKKKKDNRGPVNYKVIGNWLLCGRIAKRCTKCTPAHTGHTVSLFSFLLPAATLRTLFRLVRKRKWETVWHTLCATLNSWTGKFLVSFLSLWVGPGI